MLTAASRPCALPPFPPVPGPRVCASVVPALSPGSCLSRLCLLSSPCRTEEWHRAQQAERGASLTPTVRGAVPSQGWSRGPRGSFRKARVQTRARKGRRVRAKKGARREQSQAGATQGWVWESSVSTCPRLGACLVLPRASLCGWGLSLGPADAIQDVQGAAKAGRAGARPVCSWWMPMGKAFSGDPIPVSSNPGSVWGSSRHLWS